MPRTYKELEGPELVDLAAQAKAGVSIQDLAEKFDLKVASVKTAIRNTDGKSDAEIVEMTNGWNKYKKIFLKIFRDKTEGKNIGASVIPFTTADIYKTQSSLNLMGGNPYDLKYNAKGRGNLPPEVQQTAATGMEWRIVPVGKGEYEFRLFEEGSGIFELSTSAAKIKIPNAVPAIIEHYAGNDEQALLARIRYNGLVTAFLGISSYSLQSHWKTSLKGSGSPIEIDEIYVGLDAEGAHYIIAVEAKGRSKGEKITSEQLLNNYRAASDKFPGIGIRLVAAKVVDDHTLAMLLFEADEASELVELVKERHYTLASNPAPSSSPRPVLADIEIPGRLDPDADTEA